MSKSEKRLLIILILTLPFGIMTLQSCRDKDKDKHPTPIVTDADGDGMLDSWEASYGLDPGNPSDANLDNDSDGLTNLEEYQLTSQYPSINPTNSDSDNDTLLDGQEITLGTDPTKADTDGDSVNDNLDACPKDNRSSVDGDSDGFCGYPNPPSPWQCTTATQGLDCDDGLLGVKPGIAEVCPNGIDDNCNCQTDESVDSDGDTVGACTDCNDSDNTIYPGATEICGDNKDNDCSGNKICDCTGICDTELDNDLDEYASIASGGTDCNDSNININPGKAEVCQYPLPPIDENCDSSNICDCSGVCDGEIDADGDTYASIVSGGTDCDDANTAITGKSTYYKDSDLDSYGNPTNTKLFCNATEASVENYVVNSQDCNDVNPAIKPSAIEICDNIDNNCAGTPAIDEGCDFDNDNYCDKNMTIVGIPSTCTGTGKDCDDTNNAIYPNTLCGICQTCDTTGSCTNQTPTDDGRCGIIDCDFLDSSTSCVDYQDITSNRCASNGICKTANTTTCSSVPKPSGTSCGTCQTCNSTGSCNQTPSDDSACGIIDCSGLNSFYSCKTYSNITSNRCSSFGVCKTASISTCSSSNKPSGTLCGDWGSCSSYTPSNYSGSVYCSGINGQQTASACNASGSCSTTISQPCPDIVCSASQNFSVNSCIPSSESCNNYDDDCDSSIDEGFACRIGQTQTQVCGCGGHGTQTRTCNSSCSWGAWSSCTGDFDDTLPSTPSPISPVSTNMFQSGNSVTFTYSASSDNCQLSNYQIQVSRNSSFTDIALTITGAIGNISTSMSSTISQYGVKYWRVRARDMSNNWSPWSGSTSFIVYDVVYATSFENVLPGSWTVQDINASSGNDYWDDVSIAQGGRVRTGSWSAWCADIGTQGDNDCGVQGSTNTSVHLYDDNMRAILMRNINLTGYTNNVRATYWIWYETESCCDFFRFYSSPAQAGPDSILDTRSGSGGWQQVSVDLANNTLNNSNAWIKFYFYSDSSVHCNEGVYVDDLTVIAW